MVSTCLITGGAGFIGCAISHDLVNRFDRVIAFDSLLPQVHARQERPEDLDPRAEFVKGDVTKAEDWDALLCEVKPTVIVHLAAETGTGQSLMNSTMHAMVNVVGTTQMLDALVRNEAMPKKIVLASSRAVYGEGLWMDAQGNTSYPGGRTHAMLQDATWDFPGLKPCPQNSARVEPSPSNVYASTKLAQENLLTSWGGSMGVDIVRFRLQNVYGPGQSLTNPYTGIVSLFARVAKAGESIPVYEDGDIVRDFVFITDVAAAIVAGVLTSGTNEHAYDIGLGERTTILQVAHIMAKHYGAPEPHINGQFRDGDVRAAWATIDASKEALGWEPKVSVEEGINRLCDWIDAEAEKSA
ncbi:MAG: GDP-mannose 4,6-dehydratase [Actinomycetaceae bacterium]|nr:GDP-mannose 4,6-dehydratase [Actinomycetaceae bacterium]